MFCQTLNQNEYYQIQNKRGYQFTLQNIALDPQSNEASLYLITNNKRILISQLSRNIGGTKSLNLSIQFGESQKIVLLPNGGCVHIIGTYKETMSAKNNIYKNQESQKQIKNTQKSEKMARQIQGKPAQRINQNKRVEQTSNINKIPQNNKQQQKIVQNQQPLRRSTRTRAIVKPPEPITQKSARRQKQELKNMASLFNVNQKQLDDDQDQSFGQNQNEMQEQQDSQNQQDEMQEKQQKQCEQEDQQQMIQIAKKGRKKRSQSVGNQQKQRLEDNSYTQTSRSVDGSRQQQRSQNLHFSVPTRNPYS